MTGRRRSRRWSFAEDRRVLELAANARSPEEIAKLLNRTPEAVARKLKRSVHAIASRKSHLNQGRLVEPVLKAEEMMASGLRELEEMAAKLEATARKLPMGPGRTELLQDIAKFRARVSALQAALRRSGKVLKAKGK
jgi:hypothetical protein